MEDLTLSDRHGAVTLRLDHNEGRLRVVALHDNQEIADIRICWDNGMLYLDAWDADEIAQEAEVPGLDMHVLWSE